MSFPARFLPPLAIALACAACAGRDPAHGPSKASPSASSASPPPKTSAAATPIAPPPDHSCALATTTSQRILTTALTPLADFVVVLREGGCLEAWDIAHRQRTAARWIEAGAQWFDISPGPVAVMDEKYALALPSLEPTEMPKPDEPKVKHEGDAVGIKDLDPKLAKALAKWAARARLTLRQEGARTWITPQLEDGEIRPIDITDDGKLLADNETLLRLDTGKRASFPAWTDSFTAMSGETFPGTTQISLGPRSDRAVIVSVARMGAGPEIGSAQIVDTNTMKPIATITTSCQPHYVFWSPQGKWIIREPCDSGVLSNTKTATLVDTGKTVRDVPSIYVTFAADEHTGAAEGAVFDLTTGASLFTVPGPKAPSAP